MRALLRNSMNNNYVKTGVVCIALLLILTVIGCFYTPYSPTETNVAIANQRPGVTHLLGTDHLGRDLLSRVMAAGKPAFGVALLATSLSFVMGVTMGICAGYFGKLVDSVLSKLLDTMRSLPGVLCSMMILSVFGKNFTATSFAIAFILTPNYARMARSGTMQVKEQGYIMWTKVAGVGNIRTMFAHILPNILPQLTVTVTMSLATCILTESALSYLGLGVQPPSPSWGQMLSEAQATITYAPWQILIIGGVISLMVLGFHLIGDGLSSVLSTMEE